MNTAPGSQPLTGKALLQKLKTLSHLSRKEKARECGYFTTTRDQKVRVKVKDFLDAILAAQGIELEPVGREDGRGKKATYRVTVHQNGQIVIGSTYTQAMCLQPGSEFEIKLGYKHIHLNQIAEDVAEVNEANPALSTL